MKKRFTSTYLVFGLLYLMFFLLAASTYGFFAEHRGWWWIVCGIVLVILLGLTVVATIRFNRDLKTQIQSNAVQVSVMQRQYLEQWDCAYAVMDHEGKLIWYNRRFGEMFDHSAALETQTFFELIGNREIEMPPSEMYPTEMNIDYKEGHYALRISMIRREEDQDISLQMYAVSLEDITRQVELERENEEIKSVISLLYVDNYDTIAGRLDEGRRPMLEAMIYRRLSEMAASLKGILTQLEKDRYMLVFPVSSLRTLEEGRFQILSDIRQINIGNSLPLTLSIGVGVADRLDRAQEYARAAADLATGRGGDQAVVKNDEKYTFYGGSSIGVEKSSRARARLVAYALRELIMDCDQVLIMGHKNPDLDAFGASMGMFRVATVLKKPAHIVLGEPHGAIDLLIERVQREREYKEVLIDEERALELAGERTLVIVVDVNRPTIVQAPKLLETGSPLAVIDHHRVSADHLDHAAVSYIEPYASSACEMVSEILQYIDERVSIKTVEADGMFAGIQLDTKGFTGKTGVRTFEAAAFLRRNGADAVRIRKLFKNDMSEYKAKALIVSQAAMHYDRIAIARWTASVENANVVAAQAADELLNISGIHASFVLTEYPDQVGISARSLGDINVQVILEKMGGGGHMMVAGAQIKGKSLEETYQQLLQTIEDYMVENGMKKGEAS